MKKPAFILLVLLAPLSVIAQSYNYSEDLPIKDGKLIFEKVVEGISVNKATLYAAAKKWMADKLKNFGPVIQSEDITTGQIIGKGYVDINRDSKLLFVLGASPIYKFSVQADLRDGKYRARIYDIILNVQTAGDDESNVELNSAMAKSDPVTGRNKIERAKVTAKEINTIFTSLLDSFNESIKQAKTDDF
ncbi:MAG: DUF4468 domain-containing protein [Flavobacterium sp.]|nr:MAG: DUF4468 domain-containing protein [Flavobacterium sp.]